MTVLISNPTSAAISLPFPFRGVLDPGARVPIELTAAAVLAALGSLAKTLKVSEAAGVGTGDLYVRGLYSAIILEPNGARIIAANDAHAQIRCAVACSITIPSGLPFEPGTTMIAFTQLGAGQITLVAGVGVTLNTSETLKSKKAFAAICALYVGVDQWDILGEREIAP